MVARLFLSTHIELHPVLTVRMGNRREHERNTCDPFTPASLRYDDQ